MEINKNIKIYSSLKDEYDIMIIKIEEEKDIYHYLTLDEHLFDENIEKIYEDKSIYTSLSNGKNPYFFWIWNTKRK